MRIRVVILAAGRGTRMNAGIPKVLIPFEGKPMIAHLLDAVKASGADPRPVIVTGFQADLVEQTLGSGYDYVRQEQQFGTGHAVACAESLLAGRTDTILVLYGDHPFVKPSTIAKLLKLHEQRKCVLTMMTVRVQDFHDWRAPFADFGRVIRDASGKIAAIKEYKDAASEEREIQEVSPSFFCFDAPWLWRNLKKIGNDNVKREYYLTDLVRIAIDEGGCVASMDMDSREAVGVNTPEHLKLIKEIDRNAFQ